MIDARDEHGNRKRQWSSGYPTKTAAQEALTEELQRRNQGIILARSKVTLREHVERWLEHLAVLGRDERTIERYRELMNLHVLPYLGGLQLRDLTPLHLTDLYAMLLSEGRKDGRPGGLGPRTVGHVHRAIHRSLRQAVRWRLIPRNPATDLAEEGLPSVPDSDMVTLTRDQAAKLLEAAQRRPLMRTLVMLGVATGARLGELLALTWPDIDLQAGTLRIGRSRRIVNRRMQVKGPKTEAGYRLASRPGLSPAASSSAAAVSVPTPGSANRSGATFSAASPAARMRRSESAEQNGGNVADRRWRGGDGSVVTLPHPI